MLLRHKLPKGLSCFHSWFVGLVDSVGVFKINLITGLDGEKWWRYEFMLVTEVVNVRIFLLIISKLGCGEIMPLNGENKKLRYVISDKSTLINILLPLFEAYPLHSNAQQQKLACFKKALLSSCNETINECCFLLSTASRPGFKFETMYYNRFREINKSWIVGYLEGFGNIMFIDNTNPEVRMASVFNYNVIFAMLSTHDSFLLAKILRHFNIESPIYCGEGRYFYMVSVKEAASNKILADALVDCFVGFKAIEILFFRAVLSLNTYSSTDYLLFLKGINNYVSKSGLDILMVNACLIYLNSIKNSFSVDSLIEDDFDYLNKTAPKCAIVNNMPATLTGNSFFDNSNFKEVFLSFVRNVRRINSDQGLPIVQDKQ